MDKLQTQEWLNHLIEECKAIITEAVFTSRWGLVDGYWNLGKRIRTDLNWEKHTQGLYTSQDLANAIGISERTLNYALQAYDKYPDINTLPEGKNISWNKLITKYLPGQEKNIVRIIPPEGVFETVVIDPPWPYKTEYDNSSRRVASPYPEMTIEQIKTEPIKFADNSTLWLWTTHKFLPGAFEILKEWDFEYKLTLAWDKQKMGMGAWLRCQVEFCLLGIKGKPQWNLTNQRDLISSPRREHSRKPEEFYKLVEELCGDTKKIDWFSRQKREGWDQYGNETGKF